MVVRVAGFLEFLDAAPPQWSADECRLEWAVFQAAPGLANREAQTMDIFYECVNSLRISGSEGHAVDDDDCEALAKTLWKRIADRHWKRFFQPPGSDSERPLIWTVIDEAQHGVNMNTEFHRSDTNSKIKHPVLSELMKALDECYDFVDRTVASGTGLSMRDAEEALSSSSARIGQIVTRSRAGAFKDQHKHRKWIIDHLALPEYDWMLRPADNPDHARLINRILTWLRGRFVH